MQFCKNTNRLTRLICVSVFSCSASNLLVVWDWLSGSLIHIVMMHNPIYRRQDLSPVSLSKLATGPLAHTHTQTQPHLHARDWNQLGRHSSMNQMSATSHGERRGAHVNYYRDKSYYSTCKTCHPGYLWIMKSFSFFHSGDKPRGDTISMSRSLKAVINFMMDVFFLFFISASFCLSHYGIVLCVLLWREL